MGTFANGIVPTNQRGSNDDPDNDGIRNLVEYALACLDPALANSTSGVYGQNDTTLSFTLTADTPPKIFLRLQVTQDP